MQKRKWMDSDTGHSFYKTKYFNEVIFSISDLYSVMACYKPVPDSGDLPHRETRESST